MRCFKTLDSIWEKMHDRISKVNIFANNNNSKFNPRPHILATKA